MRLVLAAAGIGLVVGGIALRAPGSADADIVIERAALRAVPDGWQLDARAQVQLPITVRQGLDSGVPLDFVVELSVSRPRAWLPDLQLQAARWSYRLVYYDLTRHYRLGTRRGDDARNYRSLSSALEGLGELRGLTIPRKPASPLAPAAGEPARATLNMRLDPRALPLPLQPLIGTTWRVRAAPFSWRLGA